MGHGSDTSQVSRRWGVILAGGDGVRLRPLTRLACGDSRPKQFCPLLGGRTLLARTQSRTSGIIEPEQTVFALTRTHEQYYSRTLDSVPSARKVEQPANRGTLPAILWSILRIVRADEEAIVAVLPSDHYIANEEEFASALDSAFAFGQAHRDRIVLLGAAAARPETEYGWIERGGAMENGFSSVKRFWEKPSHDTAQRLLEQNCLWNTFVMVGAAAAFLAMVRRAVPDLVTAFDEILSSAVGPEERRMREFYRSLAPADFSRDVLAASTETLVVSDCGPIGWNDLGDPGRFVAALREEGMAIPEGLTVFCNECRGRQSTAQSAVVAGNAMAPPFPAIQELRHDSRKRYCRTDHPRRASRP